MIDRSDLSATTQTNSSCPNNIPSRLASWLYGKLVTIAEAVKRIFSRGNMGRSESLPETRPLAERTSSELKAEGTSLHTPDPQVTTPAQKVDPHKTANRLLPELNAGQVLCISRDVKTILGDLNIIFKKLRQAKSDEVKTGERIIQQLEKVRRGELYDFILLSYWEWYLHAGQKIMYPPDSQDSEKINYLVDYNHERMKRLCQIAKHAKVVMNSVEIILPSVDKLIASLTKKYPVSCTDLASRGEIRALLAKVDKIRILLEYGFTTPVINEIAFDKDLSVKSSELRKKLKNLIQALQTQKCPQGTSPARLTRAV